MQVIRIQTNENLDPSLYLINPYLELWFKTLKAFRLKAFNIAFIVYN